MACWGNSREDLWKGKHLVDWSDKKKKEKLVETKNQDEARRVVVDGVGNTSYVRKIPHR